MQFSVSETYRIFNSARLKRIAIVTMAIDHGAACLIFNSLIRPHIPISRTGSLWNLYQFYLFLRAVGRTAFPIFCFLLVEGFVHTHSRLRYIIRLLLFGLISIHKGVAEKVLKKNGVTPDRFSSMLEEAKELALEMEGKSDGEGFTEKTRELLKDAQFSDCRSERCAKDLMYHFQA